MSELGGAVLLASVLAAAAGLVLHSKLPGSLKGLILLALALRAVGAGLRYAVLMGFYSGAGDAVMYHSTGLEYAEQFLRFDFSAMTDRTQWRGGEWWGTQFVFFPTALLLILFGPGMLTGFVAFSLFAFVGLVGFVYAFSRTYPHVPARRYAAWLWLFPSLWFWPSSIGKEAIMMLGVGVAIAALADARGRTVQWPLLLAGVGLTFAIRPQVSAVLLCAIAAGHWVASQQHLTPRALLQGAIVLAIGVGGVWYSLKSIGAGGFDVEGVQTYMETDPARRVGGRSAIEAPTLGIAGIPQALLNVVLRPFPWEARNPMVVFSSLETVFLGLLLWFRRRRLIASLQCWRHDRLVAVSLVFTILYATALGLMVTNLGIIARQRILLYPFVFLLLERVPRRVDGGIEEDSSAGDFRARAPAGV